MKILKLRNWSVMQKLSALTIVAILPLSLVIYFHFLDKVEKKLYSEKRNLINSLVDSTYSIIEHYGDLAKNGILNEKEAKRRATEEINKIRYGENDYFWINDVNGIMIMHAVKPKLNNTSVWDMKDPNGVYLFREMSKAAKSDGKGFVEYMWPKPGFDDPQPKYSYIKYYSPWKWILGTGIYVNDVESELSTFNRSIGIVLVVVIFLTFLLSYMIASRLSKRIKFLNNSAHEISSGNMDVEVDDDSDDEIGNLSLSFNKMVGNIKKMMFEIQEKQKIAELAKIDSDKSKMEIEDHQKYLQQSVEKILLAMEQFADGDLSIELDVEKEDTIGRLFLGFNLAVKNMAKSISILNDMTNSVAASSTEISSNTQQMAAGSSQQSSQAHAVVGAVHQVAATVNNTVKNVEQANISAKMARKSAKIGEEVILDTLNSMKKIGENIGHCTQQVKELGDSSTEINEVVGVIKGIANQTNLLALNAAIEAARAGKQGKGFAVVAGEVRQLATKTAGATEKITKIIEKIQIDIEMVVQSIEEGGIEVEKGKTLAEKAGQSLNEMLENNFKVTSAINELSSAAKEQSDAIENISKNIEGISNVIEESSEGVHQIARAVEDQNQMSQSLQELVENYKLN